MLPVFVGRRHKRDCMRHPQGEEQAPVATGGNESPGAVRLLAITRVFRTCSHANVMELSSYRTLELHTPKTSRYAIDIGCEQNLSSSNHHLSYWGHRVQRPASRLRRKPCINQTPHDHPNENTPAASVSRQQTSRCTHNGNIGYRRYQIAVGR